MSRTKPDGQRLVLAEGEALFGLADLVGNLLAAVDEVAEDLGGVTGQAGQGVSEVKIAHEAVFAQAGDYSCLQDSVQLGGYWRAVLGRLADAEPAGAVVAHVVDQRRRGHDPSR